MKTQATFRSRFALRVAAALSCLLPFAAPAAERVYITEFMAANTRTLLDRDREYSDWIELYNGGSEPVNLANWCLTDNRDTLDKWRFPAVTIGPSEYLIVFASEKNRRVPGAELHSNFKLSADGEYLALVRPDGRTIAMEFAPKFPRQAADVSFGLAMSNPKTALVAEGAPKKVLVPTRDIGMSWLTPEFDDSGWTAATKGVGFDGQGTYGPHLGLDLKGQMPGRNSSAYVRIPFVVTNTMIESMKLRVRYDDGFVAYLNGWEVARANAPATLSWNAAATAEHGSAIPIEQVERFDADAGRYYWTAQLNAATKPKEHPTFPGSTNRHLRLVNGQMANQINSIAFPSAGSGESDTAALDLDYRFSGTGEGTERLSVLLIPNSVHGAEGVGVRLDALQNARDPNFPGVLAVQILHSPEDGKNALTLHWDGSRLAAIDVPTAPFRQRVFHHARIELKKGPTGIQATATLTSDSMANSRAPQTTATATAIVAGMKLGDQRVQLAGRIGHWDQTIDVDDVRFQIAGAAGLVGEEFDLTSHLSALKEGANVLGLHALNRSPADPSFFILPELLAGLSAARTNETLFLLEPTPGAANRSGHPVMAPPPVFLTRGGVFKDSVKVELAAKSGVVRYTLDGSEPSGSSREYSEALTLNRSTLIRAKTFLPNHAPSPTVVETFTIVDPDQAALSSNLPLVIINSFGRYISPNNKSAVSMRFINTRNGRATLLGPEDYDGRASVNLRGHSTLRQPKNSMTVRLKDENDDKVKATLFGLPKESDWVLYAPYADKTLIRDALAYEISNAMGRYAPRTRFVEVYLDRNGGRLSQSDYAGVYLLVERIRTGKNRLDLDIVKPDDNKEPEISGGYLFKRDHSERYEPGFRTSRGNNFTYVEPNGKEITREQSGWLSRYISQFEQSLYGPNFRDPAQGYARYLDTEAFIDQHWLIETTKNIDGFRYSAFVHKERGGKLKMGPAWDWNLSFGNANYHDGDDPRGWYTDMLRESEISWFRRLSDDPEFMQRTIDRWVELRQTVFSRTWIQRRIDEMASELNEAQARNFRQWPVLGRRVHPNYFVGRTYQEEIDWMKQWIVKRIDWIDAQFVSPPSIKTGNGGALTLSGSSGQIYYTVDGSDPRSVGGKPATTSTLYTGPVSLGKDQTLRARTKRGEQWSGIRSSQDKPE